METTCARRLLGVCALVAAGPLFGQVTASRPMRIVVAAQPGSIADEQIRALAPTLSEALGRTLLIDNRGSNQGIAASESAARSEPNGNTLLMGSSLTHAAAPVLHARLAYDPVRDFVGVTQISRTGTIIAGRVQLPGNDIEGLIRQAATTAQTLRIASEDGLDALAAQGLGRQLGFPLQIMRQASPLQTMAALRSGTIDMALLTPYVARPHVHAGRLKAFGITGPDRSSVLPEVATLIEQGIEGYDLPSWEGLFAPMGTPAASIDAAHRAMQRALSTRLARDLYRELGITPVGNSPEAFAAILKHDLAVFRQFAASGTQARE